MKFEQFEFLRQNLLAKVEANDRFADIKNADKLHPLVLAYIGDTVFSLYVRLRLLDYEQNKVQILHNFSAKIVSATGQAAAMRLLEDELTDKERSVFRRGRNTSSAVPKSACVADYRLSTGFEALLGYWYLDGDNSRLEEMLEKAFLITIEKINENKRERLS